MVLVSRVRYDLHRYTNQQQLTDGTCGSTCATFAEMLKTQAGVKSLVMGGVPITGPMQAVSGTRGQQEYEFSEIDAIAKQARNFATSLNINPYDNTTENLLPAAPIVRYSQAKIEGNNLNTKNLVRYNSSVATQVTYQAADCRLWYTPPMVIDYSQIWIAAAQAMWSGSNGGMNTGLCVQDSTNHHLPRRTSPAWMLRTAPLPQAVTRLAVLREPRRAHRASR